MKSIYESIKNIMEGGGGAAQRSMVDQAAPGSPAAKSLERGQAIKDWFKSRSEGSKIEAEPQSWRNYSRGKENTLPKTVHKDKWNSKFDVTQTAPVAVRDNGVKPGNEKTPDSGIKPVKDTNLASQVGKPKTDRQTVQTLGKKPAAVAAVKDQGQKDREAAADAANKVNQAAVAKQKENEAGKAPEEPKDRFAAASSSPKPDSAESKPSESPEDNVFSGSSDGRAARAMSTPSKRASILPPDTMQKNLDQARKNLAKLENEPDEDQAPSAKTMSSKSKSEDQPQASETPAPKAKEDENTKTDAEGRTYVRQKGVMGQPDTWNRSYASAGDFLNKIKGKGDINGKVTTKEDYVNKTFGVSKDLVSSIMEVLKKKESSAPRNDKEQDLAAHYGDPKRITHGDVLVARGVIKPKKLREDNVQEGIARSLGKIAGAVEKGVEDIKKDFSAGRADAKSEKPQAASTRPDSSKPSAPSTMGTEPNTPPKDSGKPNRAQAYGGGKPNKPNTMGTEPNKPNIKEGALEDLVNKASDAVVSKLPGGKEEIEKRKKYEADFKKAKENGTEVPAMYSGHTIFANKSKIKESVSRRLAYNALSRMAEASDYTLDPKLKSPNSDSWNKPGNEKFKSEYHQGGNAAYDMDLRGQKKYKERTSGGAWNKLKDALGVDKPDENYGPRKESKDTPGNSYEHQCAIHVKSESFGEGRTVTTQHADPDRDGYIAWYDVMFEHGIEKYVPTAELEILVSETHMHSKRKKAMNEAAPEEDEYAPESAKAKRKAMSDLGIGADKPAAAPATAPAGQAAMSYAPASSKPAADTSEPAAAAPAPATAPKGQAASSYAGARSVDAQGSAPAQAAATPKPAQSDALSAIDGGSIGTSQSSFQTGPRDLKQGIAANAPAARVVSTSAGAKEAGYTQPNQRIAGFKSNARAREQAAGAAGVEAPMPGGGGKTIAQVRQELGGKPVSGTPAAAAQNKSQASSAPAPAGQSPREADFARRIADLKKQAQSAGIAPDRAQFSAGMKPGETRTATGSYNTATGERSFNQASNVQPPAGESPEEKARKAAAQKKPSGSFVGQGMEGRDF